MLKGQDTDATQRLAKMQSLEKLNKLDFPSASSFFHHYQKLLNTGVLDLTLSSQRIGKKGYQYLRFKQEHLGHEVIGGHYILHSLNNRITKGRGNIIPNLPDRYKDIIDKQIAISVAKDKTNNLSLNALPIPINPTFNFKKTSSKKVWIDLAFPDKSGNYVLAYEILLEADYPILLKERVYINASNGKYITSLSDIHTSPVETIAETFFYGPQEITVDLKSGTYEMLDSTRDSLRILDNDNGDQIVSNLLNIWNFDSGEVPKVAADAHYCTAAYHDLLKNKFDWDGIDGLGGALITRINQNGKYYTNAFWDGTRASFGNGDCHSYHALTTLDVVGHEFAHGFIDYTSDLVYRNQPGALNESTADIFGKTLEYLYDYENFSWNIAQRSARNETVSGFRSMSDPTIKRDPKLFGGNHWYTGLGDNGGVHSNSGVMNYWYYLLVEGGSGTNENGYDFDVNPIGIHDAFDIVFYMHLAYLGPDSDYFDAYDASISQATDLFGANSPQLESVIEAWMACGLFEGMNSRDLSIELTQTTLGLCPGESKTVDVIIRNVGTESFMQGSSIELQYALHGTAYNEPLVLSQNLNPEDSIIYTLNQSITTGTSLNFNISIFLDAPGDLNQLNNSGTVSARGSESAGTDIRLVNFRFRYDNTCGVPQLRGYTYNLQNTGCAIIPEGDSIYFKVSTENQEFVIGRDLFFDFSPGNYQGSSRNFDDIIQGDFKNYSVELLFNPDVNLENNSYTDEISYLTFIEKDYFENFTPEVDRSMFFVETNQYYGQDSIYHYNDEHVLALAGLRTAGSFVNCAELEDFKNQYYFPTRVNYCVETMGMDQPIFSFDLTQLRNESFTANISNNAYQCLVQVLTDSTTSEVIYDQPNGESVLHEFELPKGYSGELEIFIITISGNADSFENNLEDTDAVLLDNVRLYDKAEEDIKFADAEYSLFPNPALNIFTVQSKNPNQVFDLVIYDQLGRKVEQFNNIAYTKEIDLSNHSSGVYYVSLLIENNLAFQEKLVLIH